MNISIHNGRVIDPALGTDTITDLFIADGHVVAQGAAPGGFVAERRIDAAGLIVCPGLIDLSARVDPLGSELLAAVASGITTLACPPDTQAPLDEPGLAERLIECSAAHGLARVLPVGALTQGLAGEKLAELAVLAQAGCIAFSHGKQTIADTQLLLHALQYASTFGYTILLHAQDHFLAREGIAHAGQVAARLGLPGIPGCAETVAIATALELARVTGARLHLAQISSAAGIALIRAARAADLAVTCDVAIHHLHLTEMDIGFFDANARLEPPLRSAHDRDALRAAVADGLAAICSDHTPVAADGKQRPFGDALPGATALDILLPLTLKLAAESRLPLTKALARITSDAAAILGIDGGSLAVGARADICLFDPHETWRVQPAALRSWGKNTPFLGYVMEGRAMATLVGGRVVYDALGR